MFFLRTLCVIAAAVFCVCGCRSAGNENPDDYVWSGENQFTVSGAAIIGPDGAEFIIKGVNVNGPGWVFERDTLQDVSLITDVWQYNTVRVCAAIGWEWAVNNNKDLDAIINAFTQKGVVSILEVHDYTGIYPPQDNTGYRTESVKYIYPQKVLKEWWVDKAKRFRGNPYVWFNIMNEPGSENTKESAELWRDIHAEIIDAIRGAGAENIIVLDDHIWGQANGYYGGSSSYDSAVIRMGQTLNSRYHNLVYSLHVYDAWRDGASRFERYFDDAKSRGLCVIVGEFGVEEGNIAQLSAVKNMYDVIIPRGIGRMYWAWDDGGLSLTTGGCGWQIDSTNGSTPGNLSWVGNLVWQDNRGHLASPVPDYPNVDSLFTNIDFEDGFPAGWSNWGGGSIQDGISYNGSRALTIQSGEAGGGGWPVELSPRTVYRLSAWGKNSRQTSSATDIGIKYRRNPNDANEEHQYISFTSAAWEQKSVTITTPAVMYGLTFFIWKPDSAVTFYLDDIELVKVE